MVALLHASSGLPTPAVESGMPGSSLSWVLPGGPAWRLGVRPGQLVMALEPGSTFEDWVLVTRSSEGLVRAPARAMIDHLRDTIPAAVLAAVLTVVLPLRILRGLHGAVALASLALVAGSFPLLASGDPVLSSVGGVVGLVAPAAWLTVFGLERRSGLAVLATALAVAGGWLTARFHAPDLFDATDALRQAGVVALGAGVAVVSLSGRDWWSRMLRLTPSLAGDLASLTAVAALGALLVFAFHVPAWAVALGTLGLVALYPRSRARIAHALDTFLLGSVKDAASIRASEDERGRLAHDLHDGPLQEIAAIIRRLELQRPDGAEASMLRDVAEHLRRVAVELRPPVLDDLGLAPAIAFVADRHGADPGAVEVTVALDDRTGVGRTDRPPSDVELAMFRIVHEAIANAARHSGATLIRVDGTVTAEGIDISIEDDGRGFSPATMRDAVLRGRLGIDSMRRRAAAIGAELEIRPRQPGTRVTVHWPR